MEVIILSSKCMKPGDPNMNSFQTTLFLVLAAFPLLRPHHSSFSDPILPT